MLINHCKNPLFSNLIIALFAFLRNKICIVNIYFFKVQICLKPIANLKRFISKFSSYDKQNTTLMTFNWFNKQSFKLVIYVVALILKNRCYYPNLNLNLPKTNCEPNGINHNHQELRQTRTVCLCFL